MVRAGARWARAAAADVVCVLAFASAGRRTHGDGLDVVGVLQTAWPFLIGLAVGWATRRAWRRPAAPVRTGVAVWLSTLAVGMLVRVLTGEGAAPAFVVVAAAVLGVLLVGWRLAVAAAVRRRRDG